MALNYEQFRLLVADLLIRVKELEIENAALKAEAAKPKAPDAPKKKA